MARKRRSLIGGAKITGRGTGQDADAVDGEDGSEDEHSPVNSAASVPPVPSPWKADDGTPSGWASSGEAPAGGALPSADQPSPAPAAPASSGWGAAPAKGGWEKPAASGGWGSSGEADASGTPAQSSTSESLSADQLPSYLDFDDAPPPTEEVPSVLHQDVSTPYQPSYGVPEPPAIPGLFDRFTPPPAQRQSPGAGGSGGGAGAGGPARPSYLPAETPRSVESRKPKAPPPPEFEEKDEGGGGRGMPMVLFGFVAAILMVVLLIGALGLGASVMLRQGGGDGASTAVTPAPVPDVSLGGRKGVEVRTEFMPNDKAKELERILEGDAPPKVDPSAAGTAADPNAAGAADPNAAGVVDPNASGTASPVPVAPVPVAPVPVAPVPVAAPVPVVPKPAPAPAPKAAPAPTPAPVAAEKATLKIRSNRRVLVYVDGKAVGYTPQDAPVGTGGHVVSAMLPGNPESKQTRDVKSEAGGVSAVDFTF